MRRQVFLALCAQLCIAAIQSAAVAGTPTRAEQAADQVYRALPELPREAPPDQPNNTLVRRMILYHLRVRGRPETSRLDWQLTLSDYLGYNLTIDPATYPENGTAFAALDRDRAALDGLSRQGRWRLVRLLIDALRR